MLWSVQGTGGQRGGGTGLAPARAPGEVWDDAGGRSAWRAHACILIPP